MRLIDADAVELGFDELCRSPYFKHDVNAKHGAETLMDVCVRTDSHMPNTIDPESLPVVRQLREELALITHQRDVYKSIFERITAHGDCNDCEDVKGCRFAPGIGEDTRYNCPLWRGPQKEE